MMIDREKIIAHRNAEIAKHQKEIRRLLAQATRISKLPKAKRWQTGLVRIQKIIELGVRAQMIFTQIQIIASQPIPKRDFPKGGSTISDGPDNAPFVLKINRL